MPHVLPALTRRRGDARGEASASGSAPLCSNPSGEPSPLPGEFDEVTAAIPKDTAAGTAEISQEVAVLSILKLLRGFPRAGDAGRLRVAPGDPGSLVGVNLGLLLDRLGGIGGGPLGVGDGDLDPAASMVVIALKPSPLAACHSSRACRACPACAACAA